MHSAAETAILERIKKLEEQNQEQQKEISELKSSLADATEGLRRIKETLQQNSLFHSGT